MERNKWVEFTTVAGYLQEWTKYGDKFGSSPVCWVLWEGDPYGQRGGSYGSRSFEELYKEPDLINRGTHFNLLGAFMWVYGVRTPEYWAALRKFHDAAGWCCGEELAEGLLAGDWDWWGSSRSWRWYQEQICQDGRALQWATKAGI